MEGEGLQVTAIFGSSMEVMISVCGETPHIAEVFHCGDAYVTVVSVDKDGSPVEVPFELQPVTEAEKRQCAGATKRRAPPATFSVRYQTSRC